MRRLVVLVVGAGLLLPAAPALGSTPASEAGFRRGDGEAGSRRLDGEAGSRRGDGEALAVLERAVHAGRTIGYRGRQHIATGPASAVVDVLHQPGRRSVLRATDGTVPAVATAALDPRVVTLLTASYDLVVAGSGRCTGRTTTVVEARRDDGQVAGRFEVDEATGLLLRRDVFGDDGERLRHSEFVDLEVRAASEVAAAQPTDLGVAVAELRAGGWQVPDGLPGGFVLFDARLSEPTEREHVVHLAYSDGLSTTSLFAQRGTLGSAPPDGFRPGEIAGRPVWRHAGAPERVVWSGGGAVWTLVSDAPPDVVRDAVATLPRDRPEDDGVLARLGRGLGRLAAALRPFD